ncbi:MAG: sialate O-acetylesterase [Oscillospiraceae bacterium]
MLKDFSQEEFDIIIQAGQSNSDGTGYGVATKPYIPNETVWYLNNDFTITTAQECVNENQIQSNYSLSFAREYISNGMLKDNRKLLILRTSIGGTGFLDGHWGLNDDLFLKMMKMIQTALGLNKNNKLVAFLWHQGETDALLNASYQVHYDNLFTLINTVKTAYNCNDLPFIAGDFVKHWKDENASICEPVIAAIKDVCAKCKNGAFVNTEELLSNAQTYECEDIIHFSRESLYLLGVKYFNEFKAVKSNS